MEKNIEIQNGFYSYIISLPYQCPSAAAFRGPSASLGCSLFCFRLPRLLPRSVFGRFSGPCFRESSAKGPRRLRAHVASYPKKNFVPQPQGTAAYPIAKFCIPKPNPHGTVYANMREGEAKTIVPLRFMLLSI